MKQDIRNVIFQEHQDERYIAHILPEREGVLSGAEEVECIAEELGLPLLHRTAEGGRVCPGDPVFSFSGTPMQLAQAEDLLIGALAKPSGIATAAKAFYQAADEKLRVVCGSWKKVPEGIRTVYRKAVLTGGCGCRILEEPMLYLDKNYVAMLDGIKKTLEYVNSVPELKDRKKVIQVKGKMDDLGAECWAAAAFGADIIYVDTGRIEDLDKLVDALEYMPRVPQIAFGGNVKLEDIEKLKAYPVDIVGVGRAIIDAPMLDMKMDVIPKKRICMCRQEDLLEEITKATKNEKNDGDFVKK